MDVVPIGRFIALTDNKVYALRKIVDKVVLTPIDAVFGWLQRMCRIAGVAMSEFPGAEIRCPDTPKLGSCAFSVPLDVLRVGVLASANDDSILLVEAKDTCSIDGQSVGSSLDAIDRDLSVVLVDVRPILVGFGVKVILVIDLILTQNGDGIGRPFRKVEFGLPASPSWRGDIARNFVGDIVVERCGERRIGVLGSIASE